MSRLQDVILRDLRASQPAANTVAPGTLFFVTDEDVIERSDGTNWQTYSGSGGGGITQLTGDVTAGPGSGSQAATLANTAVTPGSYTSANLTVDAKGRITAASNGSSGSSVYTLVQRDFSEAELESMASVPIEMVAAPGADEIIIPVQFIWELDLTVIYSNNPTVSVTYAGSTTNIMGSLINTQMNGGVQKKLGMANPFTGVVATNYGTFDPRGKAVHVKYSVELTGSGSATSVGALIYTTIVTT